MAFAKFARITRPKNMEFGEDVERTDRHPEIEIAFTGVVNSNAALNLNQQFG